MHNGDYSGRRFSSLSTIDVSNVSSLTRAWVYRPDAGNAPAGGGGKTSVLIKGTPVVVNGVMYVTIPDHVWAVDARSGKEIWHATWPSKGGWHIGNRGVAVLGSTVYVETPDCNLVALNAADGSEKWRTEICDLEQFYYASAAPLIVKNHVIVGVSGDDLDIPGYIEAHDPETGARQWRWYTYPEPGTPEAKTWPTDEAAAHGGGMTWGSTHLRSRSESDLLRHRQPAARDQRPQAAGRQPVHRVDRRAQSRHREAGVVLPVVAARHARLGRHPDAGAHRRRGQRAAAQAARAGEPQRLVLPARSHHRPEHHQPRVHQDQLDEGRGREGPADSQPGEGAADRRRAGDAESGRRAELAAAELQPANGSVLRERLTRLQRVLPLRERGRREAAGLGRQRSRRMVRGDAAGDRLQDRSDRVEPQVGGQRERSLGTAEHGGQRALRGRCLVELRRVRCGQGRADLARPPARVDHQRTDHL